MKISRASRRYAGALLELASELKKVDEVAADMEFIRQSVLHSHELDLFLASPVVDRFRKRSVVKALFEGRIDRMTMDFLYLLIEKGREVLTAGIAVEFGALLDEKMGIVNAALKSPFDIDEKSQTKVRTVLEEITGKKVRVSFSLDKSLVGGFLAQIGDTVYDGSVRRQLELLKRQLSDGASLDGR